jgi:ferredoxin
MAELDKRWSENAPGRYYVDEQCIDCDACRMEAPENFVRNESHGYSFVSKQPESLDEEARCKAAMEACPVEAIGSDGSASGNHS